MRNLTLLLLACLLLSPVALTAAETQNDMKYTTVSTSIGEIAYYKKEVKGTTPILFLHGVYYDHNLWNYQTSRITDRTTITLDMPLHGKSKDISRKDWTMEDCSNMLIEVMDALEIDQCYAVGHSWGSMTILRAASQHPDRFVGIGLCNMPLDEGSTGARMKFGFQHMMLGFRGFYTDQVAKTMFAAESREQQPEIVEYLELSMGQLSNREVKQTDRAVISQVESGRPYLEQLRVPALALRGNEDYVPTPEGIPTTLVDGKHTSPLEQPEEVLALIRKVLADQGK